MVVCAGILAAYLAFLAWWSNRKPERHELCEVCGKSFPLSRLHSVVSVFDDSALLREAGVAEGGTAMAAFYCPSHCPECSDTHRPKGAVVHGA